MKFLSELRTCCGGTTATKAVEGLQPELNRLGGSHVISRGKKLKKTENWKPVLHVISEDKTISDIDRYSYNEKTVGKSNNKRASKDNVKSGQASKRFGDGYWKMSYAIAMPVLSGAPF